MCCHLSSSHLPLHLTLGAVAAACSLRNICRGCRYDRGTTISHFIYHLELSNFLAVWWRNIQYFVYVVVGRAIYQRQNRRRREALGIIEDDEELLQVVSLSLHLLVRIFHVKYTLHISFDALLYTFKKKRYILLNQVK